MNRLLIRRALPMILLAGLVLLPGSEGWSGMAAEGDRLASQHRLQSAIHRYQESALFPGGATMAQLRLGRTYLRRGQPREAVEAFRQAEAAGAGYEALLGLAEALEQDGDRPASLAALGRALTLRPQDAEAWTRLVERAARSGLSPEEIQGLLGDVSAPSAGGTLGQRVDYLLGSCLLGPTSQEGGASLRRASAGPDGGLKERSEELLAVSGVAAGRALDLARALLAQGLAGPALAELETVRPGDPREAEAWALLGHALRLAGRPDRAEEALRRSQDLAPDDPMGGLLLASLLASRGDDEGAARLLLRISGMTSPNPAIYAELASALVDLGDYGDAEPALRRAVEAAPESAELRLVLARFYVDRQFRVEEALPVAREAVRLSGGSAEALGTLAWALHLVGRPEEALGPALEAVAWDPESSLLRYRLGSIQEALGRRELAREQFLMVGELDGPGEQWRRAKAALEGL